MQDRAAKQKRKRKDFLQNEKIVILSQIEQDFTFILQRNVLQ